MRIYLSLASATLAAIALALVLAWGGKLPWFGGPATAGQLAAMVLIVLCFGFSAILTGIVSALIELRRVRRS